MSPSALTLPPLAVGLELSASAACREIRLPSEILANLVCSATNPAPNSQTSISTLPLIASQTLHPFPNEFLATPFTSGKPVLPILATALVASAVRVVPELQNKVAPVPTKLTKKSHKRQGPPKEKPARNPDLLSPAEAAAFLGKAEGTLTNWRSLKKGPPWRKHEGGIFYSRATLVRWSTNHEVNPGHECKRPGRKILGL